MASRREGLAVKNFSSAVNIGVIQKHLYKPLWERV